MARRGTNTWTVYTRISEVRAVGEPGAYTFRVSLVGARHAIEVSAWELGSLEMFQAAVLTQTGRPFTSRYVERGEVDWQEVWIPKLTYDGL